MFNRSPPELLEEIIVVDDNSDDGRKVTINTVEPHCDNILIINPCVNPLSYY